MPAILDADRSRKLAAAGMVVSKPVAASPAAPAQSDRTAELATAVAAITTKLSSLNKEQLDAVMAMAATSRDHSDALLSAVKALTTERPAAHERWEFAVTERDRNGRIVSMTANQVR